MKRLFVVFALALAAGALVFPTSASATHDLLEFQSAVDAMLAVDPTLEPPPNDGRRDFVVGGFQAFADTNWGASAHSGPLGEDPFGHVSETVRPIFFSPSAAQGRWRITCLDVDGKLAAAVGFPTEARSNDDFGPTMFTFRDGGPGGTLDGFDRSPLGAAGDPIDCHNPFWDAAALVAQPIDRGNVLVHDATP